MLMGGFLEYSLVLVAAPRAKPGLLPFQGVCEAPPLATNPALEVV